MTKQEEVNELESAFMIFRNSLYMFGKIHLDTNQVSTPEIKTAMQSMQRILIECDEELEKQVEYLKR